LVSHLRPAWSSPISKNVKDSPSNLYPHDAFVKRRVHFSHHPLAVIASVGCSRRGRFFCQVLFLAQ
jgi:hypothetical protein